VRVLLLGDEVADGVGIARADRLSVRLAHLTDRTRGARVAAINGLIPGYGPAESLRFLEKRGIRYAPDVVVLLLDPESDVAATLDPPAAQQFAADAPPAGPALAADAPPAAQELAADAPPAAQELAADAPPAAQELAADVPPASGLLALSASTRWLAGRPDAAPARAIRLDEPRPISDEAERARAQARLVELVQQIADTSRAAGAGFAIAIAPRCPLAPAPSAASLCGALEGIAPCIDLGPVFTDLAATKPGPSELCLPGQPRWGRDAHFMASHRIWDTLGASQLWPPQVVRGHRL